MIIFLKSFSSKLEFPHVGNAMYYSSCTVFDYRVSPYAKLNLLDERPTRYEFICGPLPFGAGEDFDGDPQMELFRQILEAPLKFPSYVKETAAVHVLTNLLEKIPELRLGAAADKANEIKRHAYFEEIDFDPVAGGYMEPPWKPNKAALRAQWEKCEEDKISDKSSDFGDLDGMTTPERNKEKKKWEWCEEF